MTDLIVGQKLIYVRDRIREGEAPTELTIKKVARKWAYCLGSWRVDKATLWVDGGDYSPPGRCYLSVEQWEAEKRADLAWRRLCGKLSYGAKPNALTAETIEQAAALLGITLNLPTKETDQ